MLDFRRIDAASDDVLEALLLNEGGEGASFLDRLEDRERLLDRLAELETERDVLVELRAQPLLQFDKHDDDFNDKLLAVLELIACVAVHLASKALDESSREEVREQLLLLSKLGQVVTNQCECLLGHLKVVKADENCELGS